jgi:hypothetical protein
LSEIGYNLPIFPFNVSTPYVNTGLYIFSQTPSVIRGAVAALSATITIFGGDYFSSAVASDLTIKDLISREDLLQDRNTICHVPDCDVSKPMT